jgi:hypothetical protein
MNNPAEIIAAVKKDFRFKYLGGGYFRDKNIPQGQKAEVRHGAEVIDEFYKDLQESFKNFKL